MKKSVNKSRPAFIVSAVLTAVICGMMNFVIMPYIEKTTDGLRCFDMNSFGYTYENAKRFVSLLTDSGKNVYLHIQLPLDFIYPLVYTAFFVLLILRLRRKKSLCVLPLMLALSDYTENIFTVIMLKTDFTPLTAHIASTVTVIKSLLMTVTIVLCIIFLLIKKRSENVDRA